MKESDAGRQLHARGQAFHAILVQGAIGPDRGVAYEAGAETI